MAVNNTDNTHVAYNLPENKKNDFLEKILRKIFYKPTPEQKYVISKQKIVYTILILFVLSLQVNDFYLMGKIFDNENPNIYLYGAGFFIFYYAAVYEADLRKAKKKGIPENEIKFFAWRRALFILGTFAAVPLIWIAFWFIMLSLSAITGNGGGSFVGL